MCWITVPCSNCVLHNTDPQLLVGYSVTSSNKGLLLKEINKCMLSAAVQVRRGPRGGHIPGAISLPRPALLDEATDWLKPLEQQQQILQQAGIALPNSSSIESSSSSEKIANSAVEQKVVIYCNGGVAACTAALALHRLGHRSWSVYDGSWNEYSASELPVAQQ